MASQRSEINVQSEEVTCNFCSGRGTDPFGIMSWLSTCCVCKGKGTVRVSSPYITCPHCGGTGAIKTFTCTACRGTGFVALGKGPRETCPDCKGSGDDSSNPYLPCLRCHGRGFIKTVRKIELKDKQTTPLTDDNKEMR